MADTNGMKVAKDYFLDVPFKNQNGFYVKGAENLGWGMKKRLSNIFNSESGNTVMFALTMDISWDQFLVLNDWT